MLIVDSHLDLAWNALQWNRDLTRSVYTLRTLEGDVPGKGRARNTVALPEMQRGRIALCLGTVLARSTGKAAHHIDYDSPQQAYAVGQGQLAYYRALAETEHAVIIETSEQLEAHLSRWYTWESSDESAPPPVGIIISMESADPILSPTQLEAWWHAGLRVIGPAHQGYGRYVGGTGTEAGFTEIGLALLKEIERLGMTLDLTHLPDNAFRDALERFHGPVLASHNNCRALVPHQRQFSDEQIRTIIRRGGVIGVAFDTWMLQPGWIRNVSTNEHVTLATVVDHIDHICQLAGNCQHVGIGSDLDGGYGREQSPCDLDTISDLQRIGEHLATRGYSEADTAAIMHGNWVRLFRQHLPKAASNA